jgi:hypothetical protein
MMKPGGKVTEAIGFTVFALAAGNIMVYTVQVFKATYTRPPLSLWQKGAGTKPGTKGSPVPEKEKGKSEGPGLGGEILKDLLKAGTGGIL